MEGRSDAFYEFLFKKCNDYINGIKPPKPYTPSVSDAYGLKHWLMANKEFTAAEADYVLDRAEYWPHTLTRSAITPCRVRHSKYGSTFLLRSKPLCVEAAEPSSTEKWSRGRGTGVVQSKQEPQISGKDETVESENDLPELQHTHPARKIVIRLHSCEGWEDEDGPRPPDGPWKLYDAQQDHPDLDDDWEDELEPTPWIGFDAGIERYHPAPQANGSDADLNSEEESSNKDKGSKKECVSADYLAAWPGQSRATHPALPHQRPSTSSDNNGNDHAAYKPQVCLRDPSSGPGPSRKGYRPSLRLQDNIEVKDWTTSNKLTWELTHDIEFITQNERDEGKSGRDRIGNGNLVGNLMLGDCVTLWVHAHSAWAENSIDFAEIEVWFAV